MEGARRLGWIQGSEGRGEGGTPTPLRGGAVQDKRREPCTASGTGTLSTQLVPRSASKKVRDNGAGAGALGGIPWKGRSRVFTQGFQGKEDPGCFQENSRGAHLGGRIQIGTLCTPGGGGRNPSGGGGAEAGVTGSTVAPWLPGCTLLCSLAKKHLPRSCFFFEMGRFLASCMLENFFVPHFEQLSLHVLILCEYVCSSTRFPLSRGL